jgi:phosphoserine phosphatase
MNTQEKLVRFIATGLYSPGVMAKITTKIFELKGNIVDVEENCRRGLFSIFLVIDFSASDDTVDEILVALKSIETEMDLKIILDRYPAEEIVYPSRRENHWVTVIGVDQPGIIAKIASFFHAYNIIIENCRMIARGKLFSMEMQIDTSQMRIGPLSSHPESIEKMKNELQALCASINQSVVVQSENIHARNKKLVVFDVESSLIQDQSLRHFIQTVKDRTALAQNGVDAPEKQQDRMQSLLGNAKILEGIPVEELEKFGEALELNPGTYELIRVLKSMGFKIALLSSGFSFFIKKIFERAGVDYAFSNTLKVDENGKTTGELEPPVITSETKNELLEFIMSNENIDRNQVIAVGDGSQSSHFIKNVGLSIAFKPEGPRIKTDGVLSTDQIINVLYCLGVSKEELDQYF